MNADYSSVIMGVWLVLGAQLLILSIAKCCLDTRKQLPLTFLCMVMSMWFLRKFFRGAWEEDYLPNIIMGGREEVFLGPLILMHLRMLSQSVSAKWVLKHLTLPTIVYITYLVMSLGFPAYYQSVYHEFFRVYLVLVTLSVWIYFFLGLKEFKKELKPRLIQKAYTRHMLFFIAIFFYYLYSPFFDMFFSLSRSFDIPAVEKVYQSFIIPFNTSFGIPYYCFLAFLLFIYALTETRYFKNLFLVRDIIVKEPVQEKVDRVDQLVREHFYKAKLFLDADLTLSLAAKTIGCSRKDFSDYLKERELSFTEFVNQLKVAEFKQLIVKEENQVYDMVSVAEQAGFRSKATFNRVFKQLEGITPRDYRKSLVEA